MTDDLPKHVTRFGGELRCKNCDSNVGEDGKFIDNGEHVAEEPDYCPDCDAPLKPER